MMLDPQVSISQSILWYEYNQLATNINRREGREMEVLVLKVKKFLSISL